jgi:predicted ABC-type ATPase
MNTAPRSPRCIVIAGPNGAGKTTFAQEYLPHDAGVVHFVNADLIAAGLSPFEPTLAALSAGRPECRPLADAWAVYDNSGLRPTLVEKGP